MTTEVGSTEKRILVSTKQAAELMGFAEITLSKWRSEGIGPAFMKIGRSVRYRVKAIQQWLDLQEESRH